MKKRDSNRINMIATTIGYCELNSSACSGIPAFAVVFDKLKAKKQEIDKLNEVGSGTSKGVTADTKVLRQRMSGLALKCRSAILAYAHSVRNNTLAAMVDFTEDDLSRKKKEDVDDVCQQVKDAAAAHAAQVTNWGISTADLAELQAAIDAYRAGSQNPRLAIVNRSQAKKKIAEIVREVIDDLLTMQMDRIVDTLKMDNLSFWTGYRQAREIVDIGVVHAKVRGVVLDPEDVPLKGVRFSIYRTGTTELVMQVLSDDKGRFKATPLPTGNFDFVWELEGYVTVKQEDVRVGLGKVLQRKVRMRVK